MSKAEIELVQQRLRARVEAILDADELADYDAYDQRIRAALSQHDAGAITPTPAQQAALDKIAADTQAAALDTQLMALLRVERLPQ